MYAIKAGVLGYGQQSKRTTQKLEELKKEGYPIELVFVSDTNPEQFKKPAFTRKVGDVEQPVYLEELFSRTIKYIGSAANALWEYSDVNVVFDATTTVLNGKDIHAENMLAFHEAHAGKKDVYATEDLPRTVWTGEKPFTTSLVLTSDMIRNFKTDGISILENAVESFMPTKRASVDDIAKNRLNIEKAEYARMSATQEKSVKGQRLIIQGYGGASYDKSPHDIVKFLQTYNARYEKLPDIEKIDAKFDILEIKTPAGKNAYVTKGGVFTSKFTDLSLLNESYAESTINVGNAETWFAASHLGIKPEHLEKIEGWFTQDVKEAVAEVSTKNGRPRKPEDVRAAYGKNYLNMEARVERISCKDGKGNDVAYLTQTFGSAIPSFFTAKIDSSGVKVLQEGPSDGHKLFVKNALDISLGKDEPAISGDVILVEAEVLERIDRNANRKIKEVLDLSRPEYATFADFLKGPLEAAECW